VRAGHDILPDHQPTAISTHRFLTLAVRRRMLERAMSFNPDVVVANGDHIYWDLFSARANLLGMSPAAKAYAGVFDRTLPVLATANEQVLKKAVGPQIADLYGTMMRSTPVCFLQDDHDYFETDEADDTFVTMPPDAFMLNLARASQLLYYPEFLPDAHRGAGLPSGSAADRPAGVSESFGTLRYGRLLEMLLYDCRRYMTMNGPSAVFVPPIIEDWLKARMAGSDAIHVVNMPSIPPGWSAGKWGEWYADMDGWQPTVDDEDSEALLANRLAVAARSAVSGGVGDAQPHTALHQRRPALAWRNARLQDRRYQSALQSRCLRSSRHGGHRPAGMAFARTRVARTSARRARGGGGAAGARGERLYDCRLHARACHVALLQMEAGTARVGVGYARAVSHDEPDGAGMIDRRAWIAHCAKALAGAAWLPDILEAAPRLRITTLELLPMRATARTVWLFVRLGTDAGLTGLGEASDAFGFANTSTQNAAQMESELRAMFGLVEGKSPLEIAAYRREGERLAAGRGLIPATAYSAIEQALWDLSGKALDVPTYALLGGKLRDSLPVYANVNRATQPRTPQGFASSALAAVKQGFRSVKAAPWDGFPPPGSPQAAIDAAAETGIASVAAMRDAIGPDVELMVDCHSFFDVPLAERVARRLEPQKLAWYEEPVAPSDSRRRSRSASGYGSRWRAGRFSSVFPDSPRCADRAR
jgi:hypothetical protein